MLPSTLYNSSTTATVNFVCVRTLNYIFHPLVVFIIVIRQGLVYITSLLCTHYVTVGTGTGRLEVFGEAEVPGCVYCIVPFNGRIVAAINNRVSAIYRMCVISV